MLSGRRCEKGRRVSPAERARSPAGQSLRRTRVYADDLTTKRADTPPRAYAAPLHKMHEKGRERASGAGRCEACLAQHRNSLRADYLLFFRGPNLPESQCITFSKNCG